MIASTKIDSIVRETILERGLTPHSYIKLLSFGLGCLKELELDIIGKVKSTTLAIDEFRRAKLPCNYVDWVRVGKESGGYILNMGETSTFNRKLKLEGGQYVPRDEEYNTLMWYQTQDYWWPWFDGFKPAGGTRMDEFMVMDGFIQFSGAYTDGDTVDFDYISFDKADASSSVEKYAESTIKAWMEYKLVCHMPKVSPYDKSAALQNYNKELTKLLARKNKLNRDVIMRARTKYQKRL